MTANSRQQKSNAKEREREQKIVEKKKINNK